MRNTAEVSLRTGLSPVSERITRGRTAMFGHGSRRLCGTNVWGQWRQREFKVGGTSLVSRLSACLTEADW